METGTHVRITGTGGCEALVDLVGETATIVELSAEEREGLSASDAGVMLDDPNKDPLAGTVWSIFFDHEAGRLALPEADLEALESEQDAQQAEAGWRNEPVTV